MISYTFANTTAIYEIKKQNVRSWKLKDNDQIINICISGLQDYFNIDHEDLHKPRFPRKIIKTPQPKNV